MRNHLTFAGMYVAAYTDIATQAAINTKDKAVEHKSELICIAATTVVVGLAARVSGFKAGYAFATN